MKLTTIVRWVFTVLLIYGISTEAGIWTTIGFGLIFTFIEAHAAYHRSKDGKFWKGG